MDLPHLISEGTTMPFTIQQLTRASDYALQAISAKEPIDQITKSKPFLDYLISNKEQVSYTQGVYREKIIVANDSNYQNYFGRDQVTYNSRDPVRLLTATYANFHDGFGFDEDELAAVGIVLTDDKESVATGAEKTMLANKLKESHAALRRGAMEQLDIEVHLDGSQGTKVLAGLDHLVRTDPTASATVLGFDQSTNLWWRNNANMGIAAVNLLDQMEATWRATSLYGGVPEKIFAGAAFIDAYRKAIQAAGATQINFTASGKGGVALDGAVSELHFHGVPIVWDPSFETIDALLGAITYPWTKRCYFLSSQSGPKLRPYSGRWMVQRKPERLPDRYFHYWGVTSAQGMTINKRNANAVLSVA